MNNKILELWEQSADRFPHGIKTNPERFAEAIIKECIEVCERQQYYDADDYYKKGFNSGSKTCVNSLKRNFGIDKWSKFYHE